MRPKNSAVIHCQELEKVDTPRVSTTAKDRAKAKSNQIMAIACFVFIENSTTILTSSARQR
jgi:hypothetical protein